MFSYPTGPGYTYELIEKMEKGKISFGISTASKRPGIRLDATKSPSSLREEDLFAEKTDNSAVKEPLVIPLGTTDQMREMRNKRVRENKTVDKEECLPFDPTQYGLQILKKNKGEEEGEKGERPARLQIKKRSEIKVDPDFDESVYSRIPVSEFGRAMLRGMGWKEGQGIGRNHQDVRIYSPKPRPPGLGLGASLNKEDDGPLTEHQPKVRKGVQVDIIEGIHSGVWGTITKSEADGFIVQLHPSGEEVSVGHGDIALKGALKSYEHLVEVPVKGPSWLYPHIMVRISSKGLNGGIDYYKMALVLDIASDDDDVVRAVIQTLKDRRLIYEMHQELLIPVQPLEGEVGIILEGQFRGEKARVIAIEINNDTCQVELLDTLETIKISYFDIALYKD